MNINCKLLGTGLFVIQLCYNSPIQAQDRAGEDVAPISVPGSAVHSAYGTIEEDKDLVTKIPLTGGRERTVIDNVMYHVTGITDHGRARVLAAGQNIPDVVKKMDMTPFAIKSAPDQPYNPEKTPGTPQQP